MLRERGGISVHATEQEAARGLSSLFKYKRYLDSRSSLQYLPKAVGIKIYAVPGLKYCNLLCPVFFGWRFRKPVTKGRGFFAW